MRLFVRVGIFFCRCRLVNEICLDHYVLGIVSFGVLLL